MTKQHRPKDPESKIESDESPEEKEEGLLDIKVVGVRRRGDEEREEDHSMPHPIESPPPVYT
jgi:hypothetical protein